MPSKDAFVLATGICPRGRATSIPRSEMRGPSFPMRGQMDPRRALRRLVSCMNSTSRSQVIVMREFYERDDILISKTAVVETDDIGSGTRIGDFAVVRTDVRLGDGVVIHPHVVIESGVAIGDGVEIFPGAYVGKEPKGSGAVARLPEFERKVTIGANCSIGPNAVIYYDVLIGDNSLIGDGAVIRERCTVGERSVVGMHTMVDYDVKIGDGVKVMEHTNVVGRSLVEDDVFVGPNVSMANDRFIGTRGFEEEHIRGVTLRKGALISVGAILLPAVEVGEQAVVAAGAVVSKDVPAHKMAVGFAARALDKRLGGLSGGE